MSYGLYASTNVTLGQIKGCINQHPDYQLETLSSDEYAFDTPEGSVTFGFIHEDTDLVNTMNIRGDGEKHVRALILSLDSDAEIYDEDEMFEDEDDGKFENASIPFDYLPNSE